MSDKITIEFSSNDNAAFDDDAAAEFARILRWTADRLDAGYRGNDGDGFPIKDMNGNRCGQLTIEPSN
jgi:hypothetical protein